MADPPARAMLPGVTSVIVFVLQQATGGTLSPGVIIALALVVFTSSLALAAMVGLARRIKAIGDAGQAHEDEEDA